MGRTETVVLKAAGAAFLFCGVAAHSSPHGVDAVGGRGGVVYISKKCSGYPQKRQHRRFFISFIFYKNLFIESVENVMSLISW